jgi:hypothetical protein
MNGDDNPRNGIGNRAGPVPRYAADKNANYSPSTSFNYNNSRNPGGGNYNNQQPQNIRRRFDNNNKFKKPVPNSNDKIIKQNDSIIRLLKEIRDRLPPPPETVGSVADAAAQTDLIAEVTESHADAIAQSDQSDSGYPEELDEEVERDPDEHDDDRQPE